MKNVKKILAFVLASIMALSCLVGMMPVFAAEDNAAEVPTPTYELDFTKYCDSMHDKFYFNNGLGQFSIDDSGANGYLSVTLKEARTTNHFQIGHGTFQKGSDVVIDAPANQMDYIVIKYKTKQTCQAALYTNTVDTSTTDPNTGAYVKGSISWNSTYPKWNWNGLDEWTVQIVDASAAWSNAGDTEVMDSFLFRVTDGDQQVKGADVKIAYFKFFDTMEDAKAFADSETTKLVEIPGGKAELNEGYNVNGQKVLTTGELFEMYAAEIPTVGTWGDYPVATTTVSADAAFLGTGEIINNTTEGAGNDMFQAPVAGETTISIDDVVKVTDDNTYIRFWGWTGNPSPAVAYGYQIGDNDPVFDEKFTVVDEGLAALVGGWGHPNAVRFVVSVPLTGLESGKAYSVQLLVKHEDGTISSMKNGFKNFKVANIKYDYQDAEGKLYAFDGTKMVCEDGSYMYAAMIDGKAYATDGYFYPLTTFVPPATPVAIECEVLEGVEHTGGLMVLPGSGQWDNWLTTLNEWDSLQLGWMHSTLTLNGTFGADSGITKVGYQIGAFDPIWTDCDGTSYSITLTFPGIPTAEYMYQILVEKDGQVYKMPGSKDFHLLWQERNKATHYEWNDMELRFSTAPEAPEAPIGWKVNPFIYEAADFAEGGIDVVIPTGDRQYSWVTIKGMKGKVLTIDNALASKFLTITDEAGNTYDFRNSTSYYGLALPILSDEYTVRIKTFDTSGNDMTYTFVQDDLLLTPDALEGKGTEAEPYVLKYSNKYTVMAEGVAYFTYTAVENGEVSIFASQGTLAVTTSANAEMVDGILEVSAGDVVTAVLTSADSVGYVYSVINFTSEAGEHEHELETIPGVPATCVAEGTTDKQVCTVCGMTVKRHETASVVAHKYEKVEKLDATCTEAGYEEYKKCSVCGATQSEIVEIAAKGHTAGDWEIVTEAAVGVEGKKVKKCTACAAVLEEEAIAALDAPATEAPTTEAPETEAPTTEAPAATTEAKGGCGSVIGMSAAAVVLAAAAAAVALKKRD